MGSFSVEVNKYRPQVSISLIVPSMDNSQAPERIVNGHEETKPSAQQKPSKGGWRSAIFVIFVEVAERFSYYGVSGNLITYLTNVLGQPTATAAKNVNIWSGVSMVAPILGAIVADSYLGRFNTIIISSIIYFMGMILLTLSVSVASLPHHHSIFFLALYIIAIGEGGHKPCIQTFAADQFNDDVPEEKASKISFFNWWYSGIVSGASISLLVVVYVQDSISWGTSYAILAAAVAAALVLFLIGIPTYRRQEPLGSPFVRVAQVLVAAVQKRRVDATRSDCKVCSEDERVGGHANGRSGFRTLARTTQFRFLDKAMIVDNIDASSKTRNHWRLCPVNQVEEVKLLLRLVPIWLTSLMFTIVFAQLGTYFTKQGSTMIRSINGSRFQIPAASLQAVNGITIVIFTVIYDKILVPVTRKITGRPSGITILQRMGIGHFISIFTMIIAGVMEAKRVSVARQHGLIDSPKSTVPMRVWWLLPQYISCGMSLVFTIVGMQEFFYEQIPEGMRSMGAAAYVSTVGVGSFLSSAVISIVQTISSRMGHQWLVDNLNRAHLYYFYWMLAGMSALNLCFFLWFAKGFEYKKMAWNDPNEEEEISLNGYYCNGGR